MKSNQNKLGRNALCLCGSGNKYKRCCLSSVHNFAPSFVRESEEHLRNRVKAQMGNEYTLLQGNAGVKMSEIILDLADFLLSEAKTKRQNQLAVSITCVAWNIAVLGQGAGQELLDMLLDKTNDSIYQQDLTEIINRIVERKQLYYPDIHRIILDHELAGESKDTFHLTIISTVSEECLNELKPPNLRMTT